MIPVLRPSCTDAEIEAVSAVLRSHWWGMGPKCAEFETRLAALYGRKHCVTVNSCTAALHLALLAHGIGPGDEVIVPALTFVSTALAVTYCGAKPVFVDVSPHTLTMAEPHLWSGLSSEGKSKAAIVVDYAGYPATDEWKAQPVPVIQDAAHSAGGISVGDMTCLSFHPVKNLATGDGGAILLDDDAKAEMLRELRWCGISRSTWQRADRAAYQWEYDVTRPGIKAHWNDLQAAIGLVQLDRLPAMNARRREIADRYRSELADVCEQPMDHPKHAWHLYPIRIDAEKRDGLIAYLGERGIAAGCHYKPVNMFTIYGVETPPVTAREWVRLVSLPIFADLTDEMQTEVIEAVKGGLA